MIIQTLGRASFIQHYKEYGRFIRFGILIYIVTSNGYMNHVKLYNALREAVLYRCLITTSKNFRIHTSVGNATVTINQ